MTYEWDENKRRLNLEKHGLDFYDADLVYEAPDKLTVPCAHSSEERWQVIAEIAGELVVLSLVYVYRREIIRVISLRPASSKERSLYYEQTHPPQQ